MSESGVVSIMKRTQRTSKRRNIYKPWSKSDIQRLTSLYPKNHDYDLARIFRRTTAAILSKGRKLGLKKAYDEDFKPEIHERRRWTARENKALKKLYKLHTTEELSDIFARKATSISGQARRLRLRKVWFWTKEDDDILRKYHKQKTYAEIGKILKRSPETIVNRVAELDLDRKFDWWTEREINLLIKHYSTMNTKELSKLIGRSVENIRSKAFCLKIQKDKQIIIVNGKRLNLQQQEEIHRLFKNHSAREVANILGYSFKDTRRFLARYSPGKQKYWTKEEDKTIRKFYNKMTHIKLAEKLGRTRKSVESRIETLGLTGQSIWISGQVKVLRAEFKKGTPTIKIAKMLNKSKRTCDYKIALLKLRK